MVESERVQSGGMFHPDRTLMECVLSRLASMVKRGNV